MSSSVSTKIKSILVLGLGRIGLPQALLFANKKLNVIAFDKSETTVKNLYNHKIPFFEPSMKKYLDRSINKTFFPYYLWKDVESKLHTIDAVMFAIGTKALDHKDIDNKKEIDFLEYFNIFLKLFGNRNKIKNGLKIIIRTTLPLGGTDTLKNFIEKKYSLKEGHDFYMAYVPERLTEGHAILELTKIPKIVGVYTDSAFEPIKHLFSGSKTKIVRVSNPLTAEFCKLTDNSFRSTIFAFANEIAMYANDLKVNAREVIRAVNLDYKRNSIPQPGFVSGYCLTKDPYLFESNFLKYKKNRTFHSVWYYGRRTNDYLIETVAYKIISQLKHISQPTFVVLGLSFKEDVDDFRMSHSFKIIDILIQAHVKKIKAYDPNLNKNNYTKTLKIYEPYIVSKTDTLSPSFFENIDAIVLCDRHKELCDINKKTQLQKLFKKIQKPCYLFDGWDIWRSAKSIKNIHYESIGEYDVG